MMDGRAVYSAPKVSGAAVTPPSPPVLAQPQPGGDLREENRVEKRVSTLRARDWAAGRRQSSGREERGGLAGGGAWPRCATLTRWHSDRCASLPPPPPPPQPRGNPDQGRC